MADIRKSVAENVPGDFFVDSTCIDCDACRQIAPATFGEARNSSFVRKQPVSDGERRVALQALLSCPTGSIGTIGDDDPKAILVDFPLSLEDPVYYCGFNSPKSYGGNAYFVRHPDGNWLIDSPKFLSPLVKALEGFGGVDRIFLTHSDDVADADRFARHFGATRIIHREEITSQPDAERILDGADPVSLHPDFLAVPTPGHTAGHMCLLFRSRFLFSGDHLAWNRDEHRLDAHRDYCWDSWNRQIDSVNRLTQFDFEWLLPGHGQRVQLTAAEMRRHLAELLPRMRGS